MKEIILDTETTGLSVKDGHRIVEIGCIELENLIPTKKIFHSYLNPQRKVSEEAFKVHGYSDEFLSTKQKFVEIADDFLESIRRSSIQSFYQFARDLACREKVVQAGAMNILLRAAAVRILCTRVHDYIFHPPDAVLVKKDPFEYLNILRWHQQNDIFE